MITKQYVGQSAERSERIRVIEEEAAKLFGSPAAARDWLNAKNIALGATPLSKLDTEEGTNEVRKVLSAIAHGGVV